MSGMIVYMSGNSEILLMTYLMQSGIAVEFGKPCSQLKDFKAQLNESFDNSVVEVKPSVFNYQFKTPEEVWIYNTLYNSMASMEFQEFEQLIGSQSCDIELRKRFLEMGFLVKAEVDERDCYSKWRLKSRQRLEHLSINITTTLKCNARCPYCYEGGVKPVDFDEERLEDLIAFIKTHKRDLPVKLNWFGGEPLMNTNIIDSVTRRVGESGFTFDSFIITNGSLINKNIIRWKFPKWHVSGIQVTLDGTAQEYERRKNYLGKTRNIFKRVLDNIENAADKGIHVDIRLNTDRRNLNDMLNLIYVLQARFDSNENVSYYPAFVTGVEDKLSDDEKVAFVKQMFIELANPKKFSINRRLYSTPRNIACMRNDIQSFSVDVFGRVYCCEHHVGRKEKSIGTLKRLSKKVNDSRALEPLRAECEECVFLPKCMGGCASNLRTGDAACMIEKYLIQAYVQYMAE